MVKTARKVRKLSAQYRTTGRSKAAITPAELRESMTETQVESTVKQALTRFKRNHSAPGELDALQAGSGACHAGHDGRRSGGKVWLRELVADFAD
jgi:hypothetical protein